MSASPAKPPEHTDLEASLQKSIPNLFYLVYFSVGSVVQLVAVSGGLSAFPQVTPYGWQLAKGEEALDLMRVHCCE